MHVCVSPNYIITLVINAAVKLLFQIHVLSVNALFADSKNEATSVDQQDTNLARFKFVEMVGFMRSGNSGPRPSTMVIL